MPYISYEDCNRQIKISDLVKTANEQGIETVGSSYTSSYWRPKRRRGWSSRHKWISKIAGLSNPLVTPKLRKSMRSSLRGRKITIEDETRASIAAYLQY